MKYAITILSLLPTLATAQQITISTTSVALWGQLPKAAKVTASYDMLEAVYLHAFKTMQDYHGSTYTGGYFALFANPLKVTKGDVEGRAGAGYFFQKFPTANGTHVNYQLSLSYHITDVIGVRY